MVGAECKQVRQRAGQRAKSATSQIAHLRRSQRPLTLNSSFPSLNLNAQFETLPESFLDHEPSARLHRDLVGSPSNARARNNCPGARNNCPRARNNCPRARNNCPRARNNCPRARNNCPRARNNCQRARIGSPSNARRDRLGRDAGALMVHGLGMLQEGFQIERSGLKVGNSR
jgi:hypothetical protein